jgi:hypothetical protein
MDTKSHLVNLTQKRKAENGLWQFYPVQWDGNKPDPRLIIIDGEPASWKGGTCCGAPEPSAAYTRSPLQLDSGVFAPE